jgi:nucleolar protein 58
MLVLFETPAGYALFKVTDETKMASPDELQAQFSSAEGAASVIKLKAFSKFESTVEVNHLAGFLRIF